MAPGKTASQAGHAYLGAYIQALQLTPTLAEEYSAEHPNSPGTKVCLKASLSQLLKVQDAVKAAGLPHFLVIDSGCANFFDGQPTVTAFGFGPATEDQLPSIVRKLNLL